MEAFLASIILFAGNFAPRGWALCQGQLLPIAQNTALFSLLGTTYGGNGQTTFALPDFAAECRSDRVRGPAFPTSTSVRSAGTETRTLLHSSNMPAHNHLINGTNRTAPSISR